MVIDITENLVNRFEAKVKVGRGCWAWQAAKTPLGYGFIKINGRMVGAHRASWLIYRGEIPPGKNILHECDNPNCVNPNHLSVGTQSKNISDMVKRGRGRIPRGEGHYLTRLTNADVVDIRGKYANGNVTQRELAKEYGVDRSSISKICSRKNWKHIE
jgi:hypothetical protein